MGKYTHLSISDRRRFFTFLDMGLSVSEIAKRLSKHRSTLYRELNRNSESGKYLPKTAQLKTKSEPNKNGQVNYKKMVCYVTMLFKAYKKVGVLNKFQVA